MKTNIKYLLVITVIFGVLMGSMVIIFTSNRNNDANIDKSKRHKIVMITDIGGRGDESYIDGGYKGLKKIEKEYPEELDVRMHDSALDGSNSSLILDIVTMNKDVEMIVGMGFMFQDLFEKASKKYKDIKFVAIDVSYPKAKKDGNLLGYTFDHNEGSFLVGAIAAAKTDSNVIGYIGGMKSPIMEEFEAGYIAGARYIRSDVKVIAEYIGDDPSAFGNPTKAEEIALNQYDNSADIIYHASGGSGLGLFIAAKERKKYAIGVDSDQTFAVSEDQRKYILTSMIKRLDVAVYNAVKKFIKGEFEGGTIKLGIDNEGVSFAENEYNKNIIKDIKPEIEIIKKKIIDGEIKVPISLDEIN